VRTTLEAIVTLAPCGTHDLGEDNVGYSLKTLGSARWKLRKLKLIEKRGGLWWPTERGKIMLAVIMGQEARARERKILARRLARITYMKRRVEKAAKWREVCNEHKPRIILASAVVHERRSK
jgi:hypothetical protein